MENNEQTNITPSEYFEHLKGAKKSITNEELKKSYDVFIKLAEKYSKLGQKESMKKLCFLADTLKQEEKLIDLGVTTFVYKDVIEDYIENVADKAVKIIELSRYMREIPDEFVDVIDKTRDIFDEFYVVFTDYTGKEERKIQKERRDKDPILFGVFKNNQNVADRFYFLGDWVDEYCDLTLDKMVEQYKEKKEYSPANDIVVPKDAEELVCILSKYKVDDKAVGSGYELNVGDTAIKLDSYQVTNSIDSNSGLFDKVRTFFKKK